MSGFSWGDILPRPAIARLPCQFIVNTQLKWWGKTSSFAELGSSQHPAREHGGQKRSISLLERTVPPICARAWTGALTQVDAGSLAAFRIIFGLVGILIVARFFAYGWIPELYIEPAHHFTYLGFGWIKPWPAWGMYAHFAALGLLSVGIAAGYRYRVCALLFFLGLSYVELLDKTAYLNHYYWAALVSLLMVFMPLHRSLSMDVWRQSRTLWGSAPAGVLWLLRAQLASVYVFAGIAKLNADWLLEAQPLRIWLQDHTGMPVIGSLLGEVGTAYAFSWGGALFDLTIVAWLMWRRTRPVAYVALAIFHLLTYLLFPEIGVFPWLMTGAALLFFPPDWPRRLIGRIGGALQASSAGPCTPGEEPLRRSSGPVQPKGGVFQPTPDGWLMPLVVAAVAVFIAVQVVLPLRHYAYPGNVRWNEEGYRFAWRVLLTEKVGLVEYRVHDPKTGERWLVASGDYLTPLQAERMATQPDMILDTAHIIARDFMAQGHPLVQIYADAFVAMNGQPTARLVDPNIDLATVSSGIGPKSWVLTEP